MAGKTAAGASMPVILDGRAFAARIRDDLRRELESLKSTPMLAICSFKTPASELYRKAQTLQARAIGIRCPEMFEFSFRTDAPAAMIEGVIQEWNNDPRIHGIFVHQPVPPQIDAQRISSLIDPRKDVEGIHPQNSARRFFARARIGSCTALAVMELIEATGQDLTGKEAVVVGHSEIVGRPVSMLLLDKQATVTICHVATSLAGKLEEHVRRADVLVVAVGKPHFVKGDWIKSGAIVIDVGINVVGGRVVGDVEFEAAKSRAGYITPVPGGVGPLTVMMVMKNTVEAFKLQQPA